MRTSVVLVALVIGGCAAMHERAPATPSVRPAQEPPVSIARSQEFDFISKVNGLAYRVMVATPAKWDPGKPHPVLYVLDGNENFGTATDILARHNRLGVAAPGLIVGIGYPTDDPAELTRRRWFDLTLSSPKEARQAGKFGGADAFIRILEEEVKPLVAAHFAVDPSRQGIWGYSLGGLTLLRVLFRRPEAYATYIISSPSIWWADREILAEEGPFAHRARNGELSVRVLITSAAEEQYRGSDPVRAAADKARMVDNAADLAERLGNLNPAKVVVLRTVFDGEIHASVPPAALSRAIRFALPLN
jgi:predicted alpha/beta superfamily hydrolase